MSTTLSCGQCGAPLRAEQGWCSLCYAAVESAFDPLTAPLDEVVGRAAAPAAPAEIPPPTHDGAPTSDHSNRVPELSAASPTPAPSEQLDQPAHELSNTDVMLSMLAAEHRQRDPVAGLAERVDDKATRMVVMFGGMVLIAGVGFLLLTVLGAIF